MTSRDESPLPGQAAPAAALVESPGRAAARARIAYRWCREQLWAARARRLARAGAERRRLVPFDGTNPVVYVKDWPRNCYTDDFAMALASRRSIRLAGFVTSSSVVPYNRWVSAADYERFVTERATAVRIARASGLRHVPDPVRGPMGHLLRPRSGRIEDTAPLESEGTHLVVDLAQRCTPERPLVVAVCTGLTIAASAYLLDPGIATRMVVAWLGGHERDMADYDGWSDGWAAYVVLQRLQLIQFPPFRCDPAVSRARLRDLPDTPLRQWIVDKRPPADQGASRDADAPPLVAIVRADYVLETRRVSFGGWLRKEGHDVPRLRADPGGSARVVTCADRRIATETWWAALSDPLTYSF